MVNLKKVFKSAVNKCGIEVKEGMKATRYLYSDKTPYTVVGVSKSGNTLILQEDGYDESTFKYGEGRATPKRNTNGELVEVRLVKNGSGKTYKNHFEFDIGVWEYLQDPKF